MRKNLSISAFLLTLLFVGIIGLNALGLQTAEPAGPSQIDTFTFYVNGTAHKAKIYLPADYKTNKNLPAIYLIDYTEQHFKVATDEFEKVIEGTQKTKGLDALVVSLAHIADIDAEPETFINDYEVYKNMRMHVQQNYTTNTNATFIGKGSEGGVVVMAMFMENSTDPLFSNFIATDPSGLYTSALIELIESNRFPQNKPQLKLHFSFSTSNDRNKCLQLIESLNKASYPWLQLQSKEYTNSNYENTYPVSFAEALQYIYGK